MDHQNSPPDEDKSFEEIIPSQSKNKEERKIGDPDGSDEDIEEIIDLIQIQKILKWDVDYEPQIHD